MTWTYGLFVLLTVGLTAFFGYGTYATARLLRHWQPDRNLLLVPGDNGMRLLALVVCVFLGRLSGLDRETLGWQAPAAGRQIVVGAVVGVWLALFFYAATRLLIRYTGYRFYVSIVEYVVPGDRRQAVLVGLALIPVVLLEELLFRSLLLGGLSPLLSELWLLMGLGVLFGLLHSPQGAWGMAGAGLAGIVFGLLFLWQGSLLAPIVAHYVADGVQMGLAMEERARNSS